MSNISHNPDAPQGTGGAKRQQSPESAPRTRKPVILAVDDKPVLLSSIVLMLKEEFTVIGVTSGAAALKAIEKHTPIYFLLDIEMPEMDGLELARLIRGYERFHDTPIMFLTGKSSQDAILETIKQDGDDYLLKPVEKEMLLSKIRQNIK